MDAVGSFRFLDAIRETGIRTRFYAPTSELHGKVQEIPQSEKTPFYLRSPYDVAKLYGYWIIVNYREAYNLFACSRILFNHESPLRPDRFVTKKIIKTACRIAGGEKLKLKLGNVSIIRDWGWAPEYVDAMHRMLQSENPEDFVIATGKSSKLLDFVQGVFEELNLNYKNYVEIDDTLIRPSEIMISQADATKAKEKLQWQATQYLNEILVSMIQYEKNCRMKYQI